MRTLIVGDVHGCSRELGELIDQFRFRPGVDRLFQVGDLVNRGPDSLGALKIIENLGGLCVLGNHEAKILEIWNKPDALRTMNEKEMLSGLEEPERIARWIRTLPLWREVEGDRAYKKIVVVHAGLEPNKTHLEDMSRRCLLSIRTWDGIGENLDRESDPPWYECVDWAKMPKMVVFGHWALRGLTIGPHIRGLDSGCSWGNALSGWCPEEDRIYQVRARTRCFSA